MHPARQAKQQVLKLQHLPPLSATASRLLALLSDETLSLDHLARVINQDPGLSARVLGLANSAYFGQKNPILSVEDAIIRVLGLNMVKSLAFSIAVSGVFETSCCRSFDLRSYWSDVLSIATLARQVSIAVDVEEPLDPDAVYLSGLLLDIGVLVLVHEFPEDYAKVLLMSQQQADADILCLETELIGINHHEAGAWLADRWHLPQLIVKVIAQGGEASVEGEQPKEVALVGAVSDWVKQGLSDDAGVEQNAPVLRDCCGLSSETIETIKTRFLDKEEEISVIAGMLAG